MFKSVCVLLTILVNLFYFPFGEAGKKATKIRYSPTTVEVSKEKKCFIDGKRKRIIRLGTDSYICKYRGKYHAFASTWFEPSKCLRCTCFAPTGIGCCKVELKPTLIPKHCMVDPFARWNIVPPITQCMAPIVSIHSRRKPCRSRRLRNIFANSRWETLPMHKGRYMQAVPRET